MIISCCVGSQAYHIWHVSFNYSICTDTDPDQKATDLRLYISLNMKQKERDGILVFQWNEKLECLDFLQSCIIKRSEGRVAGFSS